MTSTRYEFDVLAIRRKFSALAQEINGIPSVYFDNPGGTQVPDTVIEALRRYLIEANSNSHGAFHTSRLTDETIDDARRAMADFLNAGSPDEIVFGANMTTLTFHISRSIGRTLSPGDEIIVTRMDHDANIAPWMLLARDHDLTLRWVDFDPETGRLDYEQLAELVGDRTRLVACVYASNALGTINDIARVVEIAHSVDALTYIDAVQYAPHGPIDVQTLDCDFLACSAYKFFGPHVGVLYGKREHLAALPAYKVRPASDEVPDRWETGTKNHEGLAGVTAAVEYLAGIGERFGGQIADQAQALSGRRRALRQGLLAIKHYEQRLSKQLLDGLGAFERVTISGITDPAALEDRVPTIIFDVEGMSAGDIAAALGERGIYVWDGNYYALSVMEQLGYEEQGGLVRVGPVHYNTHEEVNRFLAALGEIIA